MQRLTRPVMWALMVGIAVGAGANVTSTMMRPPAGALRLVLNIPASRLDVYEGSAIARSYAVSVGDRGYETPAGQYRVFRVVWNPWWHPPASSWARGLKPTPPGPGNPMGRVKLQFANLLYIHGTTEENRLGVPASHGCVRMANRDLLELTRLVHRHSTKEVPADLIDQLEQSPRQTRAFHLRRPVALSVQYNVVEMRDGHLVIHPDVYRVKGKSIRQQLVAVLKKEGVNLDQVDSTRLEALSRTRKSTRVSVPLDELLASTGSER